MKQVPIVMACVFAMACLCFSSVGCSSGNKDQIVGKWEASKEIEIGAKKLKVSMMMEFTSDGKVKASAGGMGQTNTTEGTYSVKGDQLTTTINGKEETAKIEKISATELVLIDKDGQKIELTRK